MAVALPDARAESFCAAAVRCPHDWSDRTPDSPTPARGACLQRWLPERKRSEPRPVAGLVPARGRSAVRCQPTRLWTACSLLPSGTGVMSRCVSSCPITIFQQYIERFCRNLRPPRAYSLHVHVMCHGFLLVPARPHDSFRRLTLRHRHRTTSTSWVAFAVAR